MLWEIKKNLYDIDTLELSGFYGYGNASRFRSLFWLV